MSNILKFESKGLELDYYDLFLQIGQLYTEDLRVQDFDLVGTPSIIDFGAMAEKVSNTHLGIVISWKDWLDIVRSTSQIVNLFITNSGFEKSFKGLTDEVLQAETNYFIECVDSIYWTIYLKNYDVGELKINPRSA